jgi:hypothetical protein
MAKKKLHITAHNQHVLVHNTQGPSPRLKNGSKSSMIPKSGVQIIDEDGKEIGSKKPGKGTIVWRTPK